MKDLNNDSIMISRNEDKRETGFCKRYVREISSRLLPREKVPIYAQQNCVATTNEQRAGAGVPGLVRPVDG